LLVILFLFFVIAPISLVVSTTGSTLKISAINLNLSAVFVQINPSCLTNANTCDGSLQRPYPSLQQAADYFYSYSYVENNIILFPGRYNVSTTIIANNVVLHIQYFLPSLSYLNLTVYLHLNI